MLSNIILFPFVMLAGLLNGMINLIVWILKLVTNTIVSIITFTLKLALGLLLALAAPFIGLVLTVLAVFKLTGSRK